MVWLILVFKLRLSGVLVCRVLLLIVDILVYWIIYQIAQGPEGTRDVGGYGGISSFLPFGAIA